MTITTELLACRIKEKNLLSSRDSTKEVFHISLDIKDLNVSFAPGDSICIYPQNDPLIVQKYLDALHLSGDEPLIDPRTLDPVTAEEFFRKKADLTKITSKFLKVLSISLHKPGDEPLDLLRGLTTPPTLEVIAPYFCPLLPRFYSIASSPSTHPDEIHLLVAVPAFTKNGETRFGVATHFLCHLATSDTPLPFYIHPAPHFSLPNDPSTSLIMIGPGTGVAPFRAFLQERTYHGATGKNWLFFGDRNRKNDFYYENEWANYPNLRLDLAFSRDQAHKIYVQDKLLENGSEVWNWISNGAYLYVCGDAKQMSKSVCATLHSIAEQHGALSPDDAKAYLKAMRKERRYLLDVY